MANEIERISAGELLTTVGAVSVTDPAILKWHGLEIVVKRRLSLKDMMRFVDYIVESCFDDDATYLPELKDFAIGCSIVDQYTNIDMPENSEEKYEVIYGSDLVNSILDCVDMRQFHKMLEAIDEKIDAAVQANVSAVTQQIYKLYSDIENLGKQFADVFGNVTSEDVANLMGAIVDKGLDEEKLIDAYMSKKTEDDNKVIDIRDALPDGNDE